MYILHAKERRFFAKSPSDGKTGMLDSESNADQEHVSMYTFQGLRCLFHYDYTFDQNCNTVFKEV